MSGEIGKTAVVGKQVEGRIVKNKRPVHDVWRVPGAGRQNSQRTLPPTKKM